MAVHSRLLATALLLIACGGLTWALNGELRSASGLAKPRDKPMVRPGVQTTPPGRTFDLARFGSLSAIVDRPIFFEDRKLPEPDAPEPLAKPEVKPPGEVVLLGVIISPGERLALVRGPTKQILHVSVGQAVDAWKLEEIRPDRIVLSWQNETQEVLLEDATRAATPRPSPLRPPPALTGRAAAMNGRSGADER